MGVPELRREVLGHCETLQAILAFNYRYDEAREFLAGTRSRVPASNAKQLRDLRDFLRIKVDEAAAVFGLRVRPQVFKKWFKENWRSGEDIFYVSRDIIEDYFRNFTAGLTDLASFPLHVLISVDFSADSYEVGKVDWYLAEAALYEDMCVAYNQARDLQDVFSETPVDRMKVKTYHCSVRTSVLSAFYFVEAYFNGIAYDFAFRERATLSQREAEALLECDWKTKKERWISFKEKAYQYPKIIMRLQHPPFTESNCAELKILLAESKEIRDAIVHQSPRPDPQKVRSNKMKWMIALKVDDATRIVDAAIAYVRKVNQAIGSQGIRLDWLLERGKDDKFPPESFL